MRQIVENSFSLVDDDFVGFAAVRNQLIRQIRFVEYTNAYNPLVFSSSSS